VYRINHAEDIEDTGVAKVVRDLEGYALYFSRSPVPHVRNTPLGLWPGSLPYWGHYGIYGYRRDMLERFGELKESYLETGERLEQLRFLQNGLKVFTFETTHRQLAVDTEEDIKKISKYL
jgi:3-deoxy-manno-octulosonate cytidylyltransferase (CMP-KDO synthetase)